MLYSLIVLMGLEKKLPGWNLEQKFQCTIRFYVKVCDYNAMLESCKVLKPSCEVLVLYSIKAVKKNKTMNNVICQ